MKLSVHAKSVLSVTDILSPETCEEILTRLRAEPDSRWMRRSTIQPGRGMMGQSCEYDFAGHHTLSKETAEFLISCAPIVEGVSLDEVCVNRYRPGDGIGWHVDRRHPRNMVISLETNPEQGCLLEGGELFADVQGRALVHPGITVRHCVPPVKTERFVLICLYDYQGQLKCLHQKLALSASKV